MLRENFIVIPAILICFLFLLQWLAISRQDFQVAHHFVDQFRQLKSLGAALSVAYVVLCLLSLFSKEIPKKIIMILICVLIAASAIFAIVTHPTRSQDIYATLVFARGYLDGVNPYSTLLGNIGAGDWVIPVKTWFDSPLVYGPVVLFLASGISYLFSGLGPALIALKLCNLLAITLSGLIIYKIAKEQNLSNHRVFTVLILFFLNPFLIQTGIVDSHNDAFVMLSITSSFFFSIRGNHRLSALALILGGFVKYIPFLLLPIPLIQMWKARIDRNRLRVSSEYLLIFCAILTIAALLYAPLGGISSENFSGLMYQNNLSVTSQQLIGYQILSGFLPKNYITILALFIIPFISAIYLFFNKISYSFLVPLFVLFLFFTPWFQPWYLLWILPIFILVAPIWAIAGISVFAIMTPELISPSIWSGQVISFIALAYVAIMLKRDLVDEYRKNSFVS